MEGAVDLETVTLEQLTGEQEQTALAQAVEDANKSQGSSTPAPELNQTQTQETPPAKQAPQAQQTQEQVIPYGRFKEVNDKAKATETELNKVRGEFDSLQKTLESRKNLHEWWDRIAGTPVGRAVWEAFTKASLQTQDPSLASMPDDDPNKPLLMRLAAEVEESRKFRQQFEKEKQETQAQKSAREASEREVQKTADEYDAVVNTVTDKAVKGILEDDYHMENILSRYQARTDKTKTLNQVATEYILKMPGIKVNTQTLNNVSRPDAWNKGGGGQKPASATDTSTMTLDDPRLESAAELFGQSLS